MTTYSSQYTGDKRLTAGRYVHFHILDDDSIVGPVRGQKNKKKNLQSVLHMIGMWCSRVASFFKI